VHDDALSRIEFRSVPPMKLLASLLLIACFSFGAPPSAIPGEQETAQQKKLREALAEACDETRGKSDICPIHKVKMPIREVPIRYGLYRGFGSLQAAEFPFANEFISGGCVVIDDPRMPKTGKVFVCAQCVATWNRLLDAAKKKVEESKSK